LLDLEQLLLHLLIVLRPLIYSLLHVVVKVLSATKAHLSSIIAVKISLPPMTTPIMHPKASASATAITPIVLETSPAETTPLEPAILVKITSASLVVHHVLVGWTLIEHRLLAVRVRLEVV